VVRQPTSALSCPAVTLQTSPCPGSFCLMHPSLNITPGLTSLEHSQQFTLVQCPILLLFLDLGPARSQNMRLGRGYCASFTFWRRNFFF
jgi:hypothetical protein